RRRSIVVDDHVLVLGPLREVAREACVCDEMDLLRTRLRDSSEDPVHHGPATYRQELLRNRIGEGPQSGGVPRSQDQRLHTSAASDCAYGARWTPCSVTIAAMRWAGVTSKAGLRATKCAEISVPARCWF